LTNKGLATLHLLKNDEYDMVIAIGDDATDEDMFAVLSGEEHHLSVKVGEGSSGAKFRINSVEETWEFLKSITL
jgi:trehalose-phosphatase